MSSEGRPWAPDGFRASWGKAANKAGIEPLTFNNLRGTAVTRLALVGCSEAEVATITGHSLGDVRSILDAHYLNRDQGLAKSAIRKLEMGYAQQAWQKKLDESTAPDLAGELGFEPRLTESESAVLPLNYSPIPSRDQHISRDREIGLAAATWHRSTH